MRFLDVFSPGIDIYVRYKVADPEDVQAFSVEHGNKDLEEYMQLVLTNYVKNIKTDVAEALKPLDRKIGRHILETLYNGCIMLNPGLDVDHWMRIAFNDTSSTTDISITEVPIDSAPMPKAKAKNAGPKPTKKITRAKYAGLESHLKKSIIGQDEAVAQIVNAIKRSVTGLADDNRPMGVFLFAGASGVGKSLVAKEVHNYLFPDSEMVRLDCGEYQHKHENQKLTGSPPGYVNSDEGGQLTNAVTENPHTVVLLDEVEKAHPDIWNTFLSVFDEGVLTDSKGKKAYFNNTIIIMTTNLGNKETIAGMTPSSMGFNSPVDEVSFRESPVRAAVERNTNKAIQKSFRPEFLNRIDQTVVFNHLTRDDLLSIASLELDKVSDKLARKGMTLFWSDTVVDQLVEQGTSSLQGARGLARVVRDEIENSIADTLLTYQRWSRGTVINLSYSPDTGYEASAKRPGRKTQKESK